MALAYGYDDNDDYYGDIDMNLRRITNLPAPVLGSEPVTKKYFEDNGGSGSGRGPKGDKGTPVCKVQRVTKVTKEIQDMR